MTEQQIVIEEVIYKVVGVEWINPPDECLEVPSIPIVVVEEE